MNLSARTSLVKHAITALLVGCVFAASAIMSSTGSAKADTITFEDIAGNTAEGSFLAARVANTDFKHALSAQLLENALRFKPDEIGIRRSLLVTYLQAGEFEKAAATAEEFVRDPAMGRTARLIAYGDHMRARRYTAAIGVLQIEKPSREMPLELLQDRLLTAWALAGQNKFEEAIALIDSDAEFSWFPLFSNYHAGLILEAAGQREDAKRRFAQTIEFPRATATAPDTVFRAIEALTKIHAQDGEEVRARTALQTGLNMVGNHPPFQALFYRLSETAKTPHVPSVEAGAAEVFYTLGQAINRQGAESFSTQIYRLGLALNEANDPMRMALAAIYENKDRFAEANDIYAALTEASVFKTRSEIQMALNFDAMEEVDASVSMLRSVTEREPANPTATLALAGTLMRADRYDEAAVTLDTYIKGIAQLERRHWSILYRRAIAYDNLKRWPEAEADFLKALELFPNQPQVLNYLGYTWVDMGINLDRGLEMLNTAVDLRPNTGYIVDSLGWAHYRLENYEDAVQHLEEAVLLTPNDATIIDHLGDAYWQVGRKLEARYKWSQALDAEPDDTLRTTIEEKLKDGLTINLLKKAELEDASAVDGATKVTGNTSAN